MDNSFFEVSKEQSRVKTAIVSKYFDAWASVMMAVQDRVDGRYGDKIAYLDLFAGPGRYEDGTISTPLMILEKAIANEKLRNRLVTIFNDKDVDNTSSLQQAIDNLPGVDSLRYKPKVHQNEVGSEIVKLFEQMKMIPTFFFVIRGAIRDFRFSLLTLCSRTGDAIVCFSSTTTELAWDCLTSWSKNT